MDQAKNYRPSVVQVTAFLIPTLLVITTNLLSGILFLKLDAGEITLIQAKYALAGYGAVITVFTLIFSFWWAGSFIRPVTALLEEVKRVMREDQYELGPVGKQLAQKKEGIGLLANTFDELLNGFLVK